MTSARCRGAVLGHPGRSVSADAGFSHRFIEQTGGGFEILRSPIFNAVRLPSNLSVPLTSRAGAHLADDWASINSIRLFGNASWSSSPSRIERIAWVSIVRRSAKTFSAKPSSRLISVCPVGYVPIYCGFVCSRQGTGRKPLRQVANYLCQGYKHDR